MVGGRLSSDGRAILRVEAVSKAFGGVRALNLCSLGIMGGSISGLIGPNGSGKTTLFNVITGMVQPDTGEIFFRGERITGLTPHQIVRKGISRTFQITRLFSKMTVGENLRVAALHGNHVGKADGWSKELLKLMDLRDLRDEYAENLSYGQQKLLEIARALMPRPVVVLLDEPFAGINRVMAARLVSILRDFQKEGTTFFVIDHEMKLVMELCAPIFVVDFGELIAEGPPERIRQDSRVREAYFGR